VTVFGVPSKDAPRINDDDDGPITMVVTGVPRAGDPTPEEEYELAPSGSTISLEPEPAAREDETNPSPQPRSAPARIPPTYVRVVIEQGDPGRIEEAFYEVVGGMLHLTDLDGNDIGSRRLYGDEDPKGLARALLREHSATSRFNRSIEYPRANWV